MVKGNVFPAADVDFYRFSALAGDRVYAAVQTSFDASASGDSVLELVASDGTTVLETDNNDGSFNASSSSIAGAVIPANGQYYLKVRHNSGTGTIRPYDLHWALRIPAPDAEVEPNDSPTAPVPLPTSGWVAGSASSVTDADYYSVQLRAGDSVYLSLDLDPERDSTTWDAVLSFGLFNNVMLSANDLGTGDAIDSEALFMTVKEAGTYVVGVSQPPGASTFSTYHLSVRVISAEAVAVKTYESLNVPLLIPTVTGEVQSTLAVQDDLVIGKLRVKLKLTHNFMADLDVHLVSPQGNVVGLFTDIGSTSAGANTQMDIVLDDEAALPFAFTPLNGLVVQPESRYRLNWFQGMKAKGTWTLVVKDDGNGDGGMVQAWSLEIVPMGSEPAVAAPLARAVIYQTDFETNDGGFTHSGTQDEWELGTPNFAPITTANSGVRCWKTDLDNTYNTSSTQDLISPHIDLTGVSGPILLHWAQKFQIESANFDHAFVEVREVGGANPIRVWEFLDGTMSDSVGAPTVALQESAGWGQMRADISSFAGKLIEVRFHLDSDTTVQLAGWAVDDVMVTGAVTKAPEIAVYDGTSAYALELADGAATLDMGGIGIGVKTMKRHLTIRNRGARTLSGLFLAKGGTHAGDLLPGPLGVTSLAPGASRTFTVTFSPKEAGPRTTVLKIGSNDADEGTFDVTLTATGLTAVVPVVETLAATQAPGFMQLNGMVNAGGEPQTVVFDYGLTKNYGNTLPAAPGSVTTSVPESVSLLLLLPPNTLYHYRVRAFSNLGEAVGANKTFTTPNRPVTALDDNISISPENTALVSVLGNDFDDNGDTLKLVKLGAVTPPTAGVAKIVNGQVQFTSSKTFSGATLTYDVTDGFGSTATGNVTFNLGAVTLTPAFQFVPSSGGSNSFAVNAAGLWNAKESLPWLNLQQSSGQGLTNLVYTLQPNKSVNPRSGTIRIGGQVFTVTQAGVLVPQMGIPPVIPPGIVGGPFNLLIPFTNGPVTFQVKNMPPGLKINHATGEITGRPLKADTYNVMISATNAAGKTPTTLTIPITILPLPNGVLGTWHGLAAAQSQINSDRGDRIEFTVSSTAKVTGKVITGNKTRSFTTQLNGIGTDPDHPVINVSLPRPGGGIHILNLALDGTTHTLTGNLNDGVVNLAHVQGWRRAWSSANQATSLATTHSFRGTSPLIDIVPQGYSFGRFSVAATTGDYVLVGRLSDDSAFSTSSFVSSTGKGIIYHALYGAGGGVAGTFTITRGVTPDLNTLAGSFSWSKPAAAASSKDNVHRNGFFGSVVTLTGGAYTVPAAGAVIMALPNTNNNALLDFTDGGLPVRQDPDITFSLLNPSPTGVTNEATIPTTPNDVKLPVITPATGAFNGSFILPATPPLAQRGAIFHGQVVTIGGVPRGYGYFILPKTPAVDETPEAAPRLSGQLELRPPL